MTKRSQFQDSSLFPEYGFGDNNNALQPTTPFWPTPSTANQSSPSQCSSNSPAFSGHEIYPFGQRTMPPTLNQGYLSVPGYPKRLPDQSAHDGQQFIHSRTPVPESAEDNVNFGPLGLGLDMDDHTTAVSHSASSGPVTTDANCEFESAVSERYSASLQMHVGSYPSGTHSYAASGGGSHGYHPRERMDDVSNAYGWVNYDDRPGQSDGGDDDKNGEDDSEEKTGHKHSNSVSQGQLNCPYHRRNKRRFNVRDHWKCTRPFTNLSNVKIHIGEYHKREEESDDIEDGISEEISKRLIARKNNSKISTWESLWELLFREDQAPPQEYQPCILATANELLDVAKNVTSYSDINEILHIVSGILDGTGPDKETLAFQLARAMDEHYRRRFEEAFDEFERAISQSTTASTTGTKSRKHGGKRPRRSHQQHKEGKSSPSGNGRSGPSSQHHRGQRSPRRQFLQLAPQPSATEETRSLSSSPISLRRHLQKEENMADVFQSDTAAHHQEWGHHGTQDMNFLTESSTLGYDHHMQTQSMQIAIWRSDVPADHRVQDSTSFSSGHAASTSDSQHQLHSQEDFSSIGSPMDYQQSQLPFGSSPHPQHPGYGGFGPRQ